MLSLFERLLFLLIVAGTDVIVGVPLCKHVISTRVKQEQEKVTSFSNNLVTSMVNPKEMVGH